MDKEESLQELRSFEKEIKLRKADSDRLCYMVYELPNILAEYPELKHEAFNVWENIAESPKNSRYSVEDTYSSLKDVVLKDKGMVPQAVNVYLKTLASEENDYGALCLALLLGDRSELSRTVYSDMTRSGITHIICVSGLHLTIWTGLVLFVLRRLRLGEIQFGFCRQICAGIQ